MADYTDVENVLVSIIGNIIYPNGTPTPPTSLASPVTSAQTLIFRGWPSGPQLDADLGAGKVDVSIYSQMNAESVTTRFLSKRNVVTPPVTTVTAEIAQGAGSVTFGGAFGQPQYATVVIDNNDGAFSYPVQTTDTEASVAAGLAALIPSQFSPVASGPTLTVSGRIIAARIGASGVLGRELNRLHRVFQVSIWAPSEALRTATAKPISATMAGIDRIALPDGYGGRMLYRSSVELDSGERVKIYERRIFYSVEFPTTDTATGYAVTSTDADAVGVQQVQH